MKIVASLFLLVLIGSAAADFASLTGKIRSLNVSRGEKVRDYEVIRIPDVDPRVVVLKGVAINFVDRKNFDIDAVVFALNTFARATLQFGYFQAAAQSRGGDSNNPVRDFDASAFGFLLRFVNVFEYVDTNGIPGFQLGQDNITGGYDLSHIALKWNIRFEDVPQTDADGKTFTVRILTAETEDQVFALRFIVAGRPIDVDGHILRPDHSKFDLRIRWFNNSLHVPALWTTGPSTQPKAQIGIVGAYGAAGGSFSRRVDVDNNNSTEITFDAGSFKAFFKWVTDASVNIGGVVAKRLVRDFEIDIGGMPLNVEVVNNFVAGWVKRIIIHSFDGERPDEIVLDPEFGPTINYDLVDTGFGVNLTPSYLQAFVFVVLFALGMKF